MYTIIISNNELFRCGIRHMIVRAWKGAVVEEMREDDFPGLPGKDKPTVVVIDTRDNLQQSYCLGKFFRTDYPDTKIICFIDMTDQNSITPLLELDVDGFISLDVGVEELRECFGQIFSGQNYYNHRVSSLMHRQITQVIKKERTLNNIHFSRREKEILLLVCQQYTSKEIGDILKISQRTVDGHRYRLIRKCRVKNTAGLIHFAIQNGIFTAQRVPNW